jgi:ornithine carbamoyltransferase
MQRAAARLPQQQQHFLRIAALPPQQLQGLIQSAVRLKAMPRKQQLNLLPGTSMAMVFEKPSLRTHSSFEIGMTQLGGHALYLGPDHIGLGKREPIKDVAAVLSRMADILIARVFDHDTVAQLAAHAQCPVINALCNREHPCQAVADVLTIFECKGRLDGTLKVAFVGDGNNNVTHSLALACAHLGIRFAVASPAQHRMDPAVVADVRMLAQASGAQLIETTDPAEAVADADVVYTDTFVSMGQEAQKAQRLQEFDGYRVTPGLMALAMPDAIFMHDMPGTTGREGRCPCSRPRSLLSHRALLSLPSLSLLSLSLSRLQPTGVWRWTRR